MKHIKRTWPMACVALAAMACFTNGAFAQTLNFERIAGGGEGIDGPAMQANLPNPFDIAYDAAGNLYVAVRDNNRIRKIAPDGTTTTLVGGTTGFGGDGGPASAAKIDRPDGLVFDAAGNLYFSDTGNRRIRRIATDGTITTVAGNGGRTSSGDGGQAINASFASVERIAIDGSGNLYVADALANRVRRITAAGVISTFAGTGIPTFEGDGGPATSATLNGPKGVAVDADGVVYIADTANYAIRRVATDGTITTFDAINFLSPWELTLRGSDLYASHTGSCIIRVYSLSAGGPPTRVAGGEECRTIQEGQPALSPITGPDGIAFDPVSGDLVYADWEAGHIRRIHDGTIQTIAGHGGNYTAGGDAIDAPLGVLLGIAADNAGNVFLTDNAYRHVHRISAGGTIDIVAGNGARNSEAMDCPVATPCYATTVSLHGPFGIVPGDAPGEFLVADRFKDHVYRVNGDGWMTGVAGAFGGNWFGLEGVATSTRVDPWGIAKDATGALVIASQRAQRVQRVANNYITNLAGLDDAGTSGDGGPALRATFNHPAAVAVDRFGNIYVSEYKGLRVRKFAPGGNIATFAGNGTAGTSGDGGAATSASVGYVSGIAVHGNDVYLASEGTLRRVRNGVITTLPGWTLHANGLYIRGDILYIATAEGLAYRAQLPAAPLRVAEHDYDGDLRSDILWRNVTTGANTLWKSANSATSQTVIGVTNLAWKIVGQGDFDGDGRDDIVWRNGQTGANTVWRSGNGATSLSTTGVTDVGWSIVGVGDFNQDGKSDLVWRHKTTGKNAIWTSLAGAGFAVTTTPDQKWQVAGVGDFDGDGKSDLFWRNATTGANQVWRSGNSATQLVIATAPAAWKLQGVGDFDGDGRSDVFWRHSTTGQDVIWNSAFSGTSRTLTTVTSQQWKVVAAGDYDGDGRDDLLWHNGTTGANTIWKSGNGATSQSVLGVTNTGWTIVPYSNQP